jgi:cytochrome oxidase Cu insertion factor (SCO1/SenC/PrrC family)
MLVRIGRTEEPIPTNEDPIMRSVLSLAVCLAAWAGQAAAADPAKPVEVGQTAPAFSLKDQSGDTRSLDDLRKKGPVALVFYRSAKW